MNHAVPYTHERKQFGQKIWDFQVRISQKTSSVSAHCFLLTTGIFPHILLFSIISSFSLSLFFSLSLSSLLLFICLRLVFTSNGSISTSVRTLCTGENRRDISTSTSVRTLCTGENRHDISTSTSIRTLCTGENWHSLVHKVLLLLLLLPSLVKTSLNKSSGFLFLIFHSPFSFCFFLGLLFLCISYLTLLLLPPLFLLLLLSFPLLFSPSSFSHSLYCSQCSTRSLTCSPRSRLLACWCTMLPAGRKLECHLSGRRPWPSTLLARSDLLPLQSFQWHRQIWLKLGNFQILNCHMNHSNESSDWVHSNGTVCFGTEDHLFSHKRNLRCNHSNESSWWVTFQWYCLCWYWREFIFL